MNNDASTSDSIGPFSDPVDPSAEAIPSTPAPTEPTFPTGLNTLTTTPKTKTLQHLTSLLTNLNTLIFLQVITLYYLDPSTLLLILRTLTQLFFVSPHTSPNTSTLISLPPPGQSLPPVLISNLIGLGTHFLRSLPEPGDIGLLVDFVGVGGERVARWQLLGLDLLVWGLQVLMIVVAVEKNRVRDRDAVEANRQDLDAEEAGVRRSQEGIEMQRIGDGSEHEDGDDEGERAEDEAGAGHPLDKLFTGDNMLIEIDVWKTVRSALAKAATTSSTTSGSSSVGAGMLGDMMARMA